MVDISKFIKKTVKAPQTIKGFPQTKIISVCLTPQINEFADAANLPPDDPIRKSFMATAEVLDNINENISNFAENSGKIAGDYARKEISGSMARMIFAISGLRYAIMLLINFSIGLLCFQYGRHVDIRTPIGDMPREMASKIGLQDWNIQYDACRNQAPMNGIEWCLMPFIKSYQQPQANR